MPNRFHARGNIDQRVGGTGAEFDFRARPHQGEAAKRRGVKFGRKAKLKAKEIEHARKLINIGEARQHVAAP